MTLGPTTVPAINDTYFYLLDHPEDRAYGRLADEISYLTPRFDEAVYATSRGQPFESREAAYADWLAYGRRAGLAYAADADTVLKIVLKVKDEPLLLDKWIAHHARIVGLSNLVILDCGSTDPAHGAILDRYRSEMLVLDYPLYYDRIHGVGRNVELYRLLVRNCRYLTVVDADEFLFGFDGETIAPGHVRTILEATDEAVIAPTWIENQDPPAETADGIDWSAPISFRIDPAALASGTIAGKSIIRSSVLGATGYIGHNLHVGAVSSQMIRASFGRIFQLHMTRLSAEATRARLLKHLKSKGVLAVEAQEPGAVEAVLRAARPGATADVAFYIDKYFAAGEPPPSAGEVFPSRLLARGDPETAPEFAAAVRAFDFERLWRETKPRV